MMLVCHNPDVAFYIRPDRTEEVLRQDALAVSSEPGIDFYTALLEKLSTSIEVSSFFLSQRAVTRLNERLAEISALPNDWDSFGSPAPTLNTVAKAKNAIQFFWSRNLLPELVAPSAEGGVALHFAAGPQKVFVEFHNEGDAVLAQYGNDDEPIIRVLQNGIEDLHDQDVETIRHHLQPEGH